MDDLFSIIVPVYNAEKTLNDCIESTMKQTYKNIELILVDDGSTDRSHEICLSWVGKSYQIKYYRQDNSGVSAARNLGLQNARGRYISFVDADDSIESTFCEKMAEIIESQKADVVFCEHKSIYESGKHEISGHDTGKLLKIPTSEYEYDGEKGRRAVWGAVFKSELLKEITFPMKIAVGEDALFLSKVIKRSKYIVYYDSPLYNYRLQTESAYFGRYTPAKGTEIDAWLQISEVFDNDSLSKISADAMCAETAITMLGRYAGDTGFKRECVSRLINIYQSKKAFLIQYDRIKNRSTLKHILYGLCPHIFVMYWGWKNGKRRRNRDTV